MKKKTKVVIGVSISVLLIVVVCFSLYQNDKANKPIKDQYRDYITNVSTSNE